MSKGSLAGQRKRGDLAKLTLRSNNMSQPASLRDERIDVLGIGVSCINLDDAISSIGSVSAGKTTCA